MPQLLRPHRHRNLHIMQLTRQQNTRAQCDSCYNAEGVLHVVGTLQEKQILPLF